MFAPGLVTGRLVERIGERPVIVAGIALNLASLAVARAGTGVEHFWLALLLVGVGCTVALTSVASGQLLHLHGWHAVLAPALPLLIVALAAGLWPAEAGTSQADSAAEPPPAAVRPGASVGD